VLWSVYNIFAFKTGSDTLEKSESIIKLNKILEELDEINNSYQEELEVNDYIELLNDKDYILIRGNSEGLTHLATCVLRLAVSKMDSSHFHFEEGCPFDKCEKNLIISYKKAEWE
jgi:aspartate oxidase